MPLYPTHNISELTGFPDTSFVAGDTAVLDPVLDSIFARLQGIVDAAETRIKFDPVDFEDHLQGWLHTYCIILELRYLRRVSTPQ